jgi:4-alpha-glucanotransferase
MLADRASGVLCHPTSFPGPFGIGEIGESAFRFVDWLHSAGQRLWQVLPLNPPGPGNSPYASPSAFAANPMLVSLAWLAGDGWLDPARLADAPPFPTHQVDFPWVESWKTPLLRDAWTAFSAQANDDQRAAFAQFRDEQADWLADYALFMAIKESRGGEGWLDWPEGLRFRQPEALQTAREELAFELGYHEFIQFQVRWQWGELRRYANERDIRIVGDLPIFVAHDSADVWANQALFRLDQGGRPEVVAGVPPDAFTDQGQLWGNPHYRWPAHAKTGYRWWVDRIRATLQMVDLLRIDHFRGFAAAWTVPVDAPTAASGWWEQGPGAAVFEAMRAELGSLPFIVEDLGVITPDVVALREGLGLPGMKVLQFAFGGDPDNAYLPHTYTADCVVYPATHDNQTTIGWFASISQQERERVQRYLGRDGGDIAWDFIRLALSSVAEMAIIPLQDVMRLDDSARMNVPGLGTGNWGWRFLPHHVHPGLGAGLAELAAAYGRRPVPDGPKGYDPYDYTAPGTAHTLRPAPDR